MPKKRTKGIDINDHSLWGYRFEFRERAKTQRTIFSPTDFKQNKQKGNTVPKEPKATRNQAQGIQSGIQKQTNGKPAQLKLPKVRTRVKQQDHRNKHFKRRKIEETDLIKELVEDILDQVEEQLKRTGFQNYICCDLRYFNLHYITEKFGYFDSNFYLVIVVDPPWSSQPRRRANNKIGTVPFEQQSLSNKEIIQIPIELLSKSGFCFLWVTGDTDNIGYECLAKWGYDCVDHIIWVKTMQNERKLVQEKGEFFLHSTQMCLIGYKSSQVSKAEFRSKISNDVIIADIRENAQKPDQLYTIIDLMMPGAKKLELFAQNHNLKDGWLSIGNSLGFQSDLLDFSCAKCESSLVQEQFLFKSRAEPGGLYCQLCASSDYFQIPNPKFDQQIHYYYKCSQCNTDPILGPRFQCIYCNYRNYCFYCIDKVLAKEHQCSQHQIALISTPIDSQCLPAFYSKKCIACGQQPILGPCVICNDCKFMQMCQSCFFHTKPSQFEGIQGHSIKHRLEMLMEPHKVHRGVVCAACGRSPIHGRRYKCEQCFRYNLCELCYIRRNFISIRPGIAHSHDHSFMLLS